ncbi:hypothetical protein FQZ97_1221090 [compost metagenome]
MGLGHVHWNAGLSFIEPVAVVAPLQQRQPGGAFICRQTVDQRHSGADVVFQIAEHLVAAGLVTLVELRAERQPVGQHQAGQEDQRQAGGQGLRPEGPGHHVLGSSSCTGRAKT